MFSFPRTYGDVGGTSKKTSATDIASARTILHSLLRRFVLCSCNACGRLNYESGLVHDELCSFSSNVRNSQCSGNTLSLWVSRFPARRESRHEKEPPQAERQLDIHCWRSLCCRRRCASKKRQSFSGCENDPRAERKTLPLAYRAAGKHRQRTSPSVTIDGDTECSATRYA